MSQIWTPGQATTLPRAEVPPGDFMLGPVKMLDMGLFSLGDVENGRKWESNRTWRLSVIASMDDGPHGRLLHVSLAGGKGDPTWAQIRLVKEHFFGDHIDAMMVLPRSQDYVNIHQHAFHLWQTPVGWGVQ